MAELTGYCEEDINLSSLSSLSPLGKSVYEE